MQTEFSDDFLLTFQGLTLCPLGNFACSLSSADFFKINISEKNQEYHQCVKKFESRSGPTFCRA